MTHRDISAQHQDAQMRRKVWPGWCRPPLAIASLAIASAVTLLAPLVNPPAWLLSSARSDSPLGAPL